MRQNPITNPDTIAELQKLYTEKNGLIRAIDVVEAARPETSPLHRHFEWDDDRAAELFRVQQARSLLQRVSVRIELPDGKARMSQVFVSLTSDREEGGYRTIVDVLSDFDLRQQLVRDALAEMDFFTERYREIRELSGVFASMKEAKKNLAPVPAATA